jgi:response regulator RpfG family c-di-GMP phosphodiesterase
VDEDLLLTVRQGLEGRTLQREKERLEALTREQNDALRELNGSLEAKVQERTAELQQAHERLKQSLFVAVKIFTSLIEMRHPETAGHSRRVAALSRSIAQRMGVSGTDLQNLFVAALLHDMAKIGFTDTMLSRAQRTLSEEERRIYQKHPVDAEMMLMGIDELSPIAQLVRHHHECFNGQGFPDGLRGEAIPLGARILLVANDYDGLQIGTISALRFNPEEALQAMEKARGVRYDPLVLDALRAVVTAPPKPRQVEREVAISQLRPGMVLSREFVHRDSLPLLTAGQMLTSRLIERMQAYAAAQGGDLTVFVKG